MHLILLIDYDSDFSFFFLSHPLYSMTREGFLSYTIQKKKIHKETLRLASEAAGR